VDPCTELETIISASHGYELVVSDLMKGLSIFHKICATSSPVNDGLVLPDLLKVWAI